MQNNHHLNDNKKLLLRNKRFLQARQEKLARLLRSGILDKLKNAQGFTFNREIVKRKEESMQYNVWILFSIKRYNFSSLYNMYPIN